MNANAPASPADNTPKSGHPLLIAGVSVVLGAALTGVFFHFHKPASVTPDASQKLYPETLSVLSHLSHPVSARFYSILPGTQPGDSLSAFAKRLSDLMSTLQNASAGKLTITTINASTGTNADLAASDGVEAFNLDKGDACFLGLVISSGDHKESFAHFQPEWESAIQYDLARAIEKVAAVPPPEPLPPEVAKPSPETLGAIKRLIPNPETVTVEEASRIFHTEFMKDSAQVAADMETEISDAQKMVNQAKASGSKADLASAQKHLLEVELQRTEELKEVAAELQTRLAIFQQLKSGTNNAAP